MTHKQQQNVWSCNMEWETFIIAFSDHDLKSETIFENTITGDQEVANKPAFWYLKKSADAVFWKCEYELNRVWNSLSHQRCSTPGSYKTEFWICFTWLLSSWFRMFHTWILWIKFELYTPDYYDILLEFYTPGRNKNVLWIVFTWVIYN